MRREWTGAAELDVTTAEGTMRALAYPALVGRPEPGDRVLLNAARSRSGSAPAGTRWWWRCPTGCPPIRTGPGHMVKARYTPLQAMVLGADEQGSPHHEVLRDADDLDGMPVVVADLHSALPAVLAGIRARPARTGTRVAYVMTDGGALPAWFSRTVAGLREAGWLAATVTSGQAFGGDLEAVTVHTGLLAARHVLGADVRSSPRGRATSAPAPAGASPAWRCGRGGQRGRGRSAAARSRRCGSPRPTRGTGTGRLAPQPDRLRPGGAGPRPTWWCPSCLATLGAPGGGGARAAGAAGTAWSAVASRRPRRGPARLPGAAVHMGRGLDDDRAYFLAAAAAGRHARFPAGPWLGGLGVRKPRS